MADLFDIAVARKLAGGGGGGGGDSDFSTATVTIHNATLLSIDLIGIPYVTEMEGLQFVGGVYPDQVQSDEHLELTVPLYKGGCIWFASMLSVYEDATFDATGDIVDMGGVFMITGDGTITIESMH